MREIKLEYNGQKIKAETLPSLPTVILEAIDLMSSGRASVAKVSEAILKDQVFCARVLKTINSPVYGFSGRISNINNAVSLLGFNILYNIAITLMIQDALSKNIRALWRHNYACSLIAGLIAKKINYDNSSEAITAGLLHDFGKGIIAINFPQAQEKIENLIATKDLSCIEAEQEVLNFTHEDVNLWISEQWKLPPALKNCMIYHHNPSKAKQNSELITIVHLADFFTRLFECGSGGNNNVPTLDFAELNKVKVNDEAFVDLLDDIGEFVTNESLNQ